MVLFLPQPPLQPAKQQMSGTAKYVIGTFGTLAASASKQPAEQAMSGQLGTAKAALYTVAHDIGHECSARRLGGYLQPLALGSLLPGLRHLSKLLHDHLRPGQLWVALRALLHPGALQSSGEQRAHMLGCRIVDLHWVLCAVQQRLSNLTIWLDGTSFLHWWWQWVPCHSQPMSFLPLAQIRGTKRVSSIALSTAHVTSQLVPRRMQASGVSWRPSLLYFLVIHTRVTGDFRIVFGRQPAW